MKIIVALIISCLFITVSCNKDKVKAADCQELPGAIMDDEKDKVKEIINRFIDNLPSQDYNEQNLQKLIESINGVCGTVAFKICFDCIETLPAQSEIRISYVSINGPMDKIIDISYKSGNKMTFSNMHE